MSTEQNNAATHRGAERAAVIAYAHDNLSPSAYWAFCDLLRECSDHSPDNVRQLVIQAAKEAADV